MRWLLLAAILVSCADGAPARGLTPGLLEEACRQCRARWDVGSDVCDSCRYIGGDL